MKLENLVGHLFSHVMNVSMQYIVLKVGLLTISVKYLLNSSNAG